MPNKLFRDPAPNFAKSINNFINIALINARPGPVKTPPIPLTILCANFEPIESPCNKSVIPLTTEENTFRISFAASVNPKSPITAESF